MPILLYGLKGINQKQRLTIFPVPPISSHKAKTAWELIMSVTSSVALLSIYCIFFQKKIKRIILSLWICALGYLRSPFGEEKKILFFLEG